VNSESLEAPFAASADQTKMRQNWVEAFVSSRDGTPTWVYALCIFLAIYMIMPTVHQWTYGSDRIRQAAIDETEIALKTRLTPEARAFMAEQMGTHPALMRSILETFIALIGVILSGMILSIGAVMSGEMVAPIITFGIAVLASFSTAMVRLGYWVFFVVSQGPDTSAKQDWLRGARVSILSFITPPGNLALAALINALDITVLVGSFVAYLGLRTVCPRMSQATTIISAAGFLLISMLVRVWFSMYVGVAV
jgi:hypothetical protein